MELNDMAVAQNKAAFEWGRHCAVHWEAVQALLAPEQVVQFHKPEGVDALIAKTRLMPTATVRWLTVCVRRRHRCTKPR